ncbi:MAG TPA: NFACT RNA binding domain-containing protein [Verrucomicrobiae bacterium]|nr:NFACT RNA binding domain-containing protein [Verrucomicrobiae bacterium]
MALDGITLHLVCKELNGLLVGGRIDKIHQPEKEEVVLQVRNQGQNYRLALSAHPENARLHITREPKKNPLSPPMFCMVLRKYLEGGKIIEFAQAGFERVISLKVLSSDELGRHLEYQLLLEIMGKHSNLILVEPGEGHILDGVKRYSHAVSRHREVLPGRTYIAPPSQGKANPLNLAEEDFRELLYAHPLDARLAQTLLKSLDGFSPELCRELVVRANLDLDATLELCGEYELARLWQALQALLDPLRGAAYAPTLVKDKGVLKNSVTFSYLQLSQYQCLEQVPYPNLNELLDFFYSSKRFQGKFNSQRSDLLKIVGGELERLYKKLALQDETIASGREAEKYKYWGELLTANLYQIKPGQTKVEVTDYYQPDCPTVSLNLEPHLSPNENAQAYFRLYNKGKASIAGTEPFRRQTMLDITYLNSVKSALDNATDGIELTEIRQELVEQGYLKDKGKGKPGKKEKPEKPEPMRFLSSTGQVILVGKNNKQNDYLTLKVAKPRDMWLHVKDIPGSHVVVPLDKDEFPDDTTLEEAAALAAYFSQAKNSSTVPVDYTHVRNVKKPGGAKPGMVIYENQWTLYIDPKPELAENLKA